MPLSWSVAIVCSPAALRTHAEPADADVRQVESRRGEFKRAQRQLVVQAGNHPGQRSAGDALRDQRVGEPADVGGALLRADGILGATQCRGNLAYRQAMQPEEVALGHDTRDSPSASVTMIWRMPRCVISSAASPAVATAGSVIAGALITLADRRAEVALRQHDAADDVLAREDAERDFPAHRRSAPNRCAWVFHRRQGRADRRVRRRGHRFQPQEVGQCRVHSVPRRDVCRVFGLQAGAREVQQVREPARAEVAERRRIRDQCVEHVRRKRAGRRCRRSRGRRTLLPDAPARRRVGTCRRRPVPTVPPRRRRGRGAGRSPRTVPCLTM